MTNDLIFKGTAFKRLVFGKVRINGRNNQGLITLYHRGGGVKKRVRIVDHVKVVWNVYGFIKRVEYDPKRNSLIALVIYSNGIITYTLISHGIRVGDFISSIDSTGLRVGYTTYLKNIPVGVRINSVESYFNHGAQFVRAAGNFATIVSKSDMCVLVKLKSGEIRRFSLQNLATIGSVSNFQFMFKNFKSAGYYRRKGWLPVVRGVAMNPIDHPHGGGQGKTSGGRPSVTPYGVITKGQPTVKKKSPFVVRSRKLFKKK